MIITNTHEIYSPAEGAALFLFVIAEAFYFGYLIALICE